MIVGGAEIFLSQKVSDQYLVHTVKVRYLALQYSS